MGPVDLGSKLAAVRGEVGLRVAVVAVVMALPAVALLLLTPLLLLLLLSELQEPFTRSPVTVGTAVVWLVSRGDGGGCCIAAAAAALDVWLL